MEPVQTNTKDTKEKKLQDLLKLLKNAKELFNLEKERTNLSHQSARTILQIRLASLRTADYEYILMFRVSNLQRNSLHKDTVVFLK